MPALIFNRAELLNQLDGDVQFAGELVRSFFSKCPGYVGRIEAAIGARDHERLTREAHGLKGALASLRAERARDSAGRLEKMGRSRDLTGASVALADLKGELATLNPSLLSLLSSQQ